MPVAEIILSAIADAIFGFANDKGGSILDDRKNEREKKKAFREALTETFAQFEQEQPQRVADLFDASFFQHEGKPVLAQFLDRDGRPDPSDLAERWADSLHMRHPERRACYMRELEPVAAAFLDIFAHQFKSKAALRDINNDRVFEQLTLDLRAIRDKLDAQKATRGTRRDYLRWLIERNLYVDSRGTFQTQRQVQVRLDEVYVSLRAQREETLGAVDRHPFYELSTHFVDGADALPAEEAEDRLEQLQLRSAKMLATEKPAEVLELAEAVSRHDRLVILGDPGSGKTTLLRYLALSHTQAVLKGQTEAGQDLGTAYFPILIRIAEYAEEGNWRRKSLSDFLVDAYTLHECPRNGLSDLLQTELEQGNCLILLDGLDEIVSADERRGVVQQIEDFVQRYDNKANRFVITSRIAGYRTAQLGAPFTHFTVQEMDEQQMRRFLERWCQAVEDAQTPDLSLQERQQTARQEIDSIMKAIQSSPGVRRLAANPLLLRILALIHRTGARLPQKRVELYKLAADTLSRTWRPAQGVPESALVKEEYLTPLLSSLAYWLHLHKPTGIATEREVYAVLGEKWADIHDLPWDADKPNPKINEEIRKFLVAVREHTGLFVERAPKRYGFMHLTFEEYYAARYLVERSKTRATLIRQHLHGPRWEEPILLALGFVGLDYPKEASELLETAILAQGADAQLLQFTPSTYENLLGRDYLFALRCLADTIPVRTRLQKHLIDRLVDELLHRSGPARFRRYREMLKERLGYLGDCEVATELIPPLAAALHDTDADVRRNAANSLARLSQASPEVLAALIEALHDTDVDVRRNAANSLARPSQASPEVLAVLIEALHDADATVGTRAARSLVCLSQASPEALTALIEALHDADADVRHHAASSIGQLSQASPEALTALIEALHDGDAGVRINTAWSLGYLKQTSPAVLAALIEALHDTDALVRSNAAASLRYLKQASSEVLTALIESLHAADATVRYNAAMSLGYLKQDSPEALTALIEALHDSNAIVRRNAARSLGYLKQASSEVLTALIEALHDADATVRYNAAWSLGYLKQPSPEVLTVLIEALHDADTLVRGRAAQSLGQLGQTSPEVLAALIEALHDADALVRGRAAASLGQLGQTSPEVIDGLVESVHKAEHWSLRRDAAGLLSQISTGDKATLDTLWFGLRDADSDVRTACTEALARLGRKLSDVQRQDLEARLVRATQDEKFEKVDNMERPAYHYVYDALWLLVVGEAVGE